MADHGLLQVSRNSYVGKIESIKKQNIQIPLISRGFIKSGPVAFVVSSNCRKSSMSVSVMCSCVSLS
jgi:hypothetical protein